MINVAVAEFGDAGASRPVAFAFNRLQLGFSDPAVDGGVRAFLGVWVLLVAVAVLARTLPPVSQSSIAFILCPLSL